MKKSALKLLVFLSDWNRTDWNSALRMRWCNGAARKKAVTVSKSHMRTLMRTILNIGRVYHRSSGRTNLAGG
jgi:hypothetical protein